MPEVADISILLEAKGKISYLGCLSKGIDSTSQSKGYLSPHLCPPISEKRKTAVLGAYEVLLTCSIVCEDTSVLGILGPGLEALQLNDSISRLSSWSSEC